MTVHLALNFKIWFNNSCLLLNHQSTLCNFLLLNSQPTPFNFPLLKMFNFLVLSWNCSISHTLKNLLSCHSTAGWSFKLLLLNYSIFLHSTTGRISSISHSSLAHPNVIINMETNHKTCKCTVYQILIAFTALQSSKLALLLMVLLAFL